MIRSVARTCGILAVLACALARPMPTPCDAAEPTTHATDSAASRFLLIDVDALSRLKRRVAAGDAVLRPMIDQLRAAADTAAAATAPAVTDKHTLPVGSDPHDYMSLAIYYWPDPAKPNGKPYVNRDGVVNHAEVDALDAARKDKMISAVRTLALAYTLLGEPKYADAAARYLRTWFLDPKTRMNPNLEHAQFVPGSSDGRGYGIIETRSFVQLADAVTLLDGSPAWTAADRDGFHAWINAFVDWLLTSKNGKEEASATNNHGEWYDAQVCGLAAYLGRDDVVRRIAAEEGPKRIAVQAEPDGALPKEQARTKSMHYTLFAIDAWMQVAHFGHAAGVDVASFRAADGRSLRQALDYVRPYLLGEKTWEHQTIGNETYVNYADMFHAAAKIYHEPRFEAVSRKLRKSPADSNLESVLAE